MTAEVVLVVDQAAMQWRSPERFGQAAYHVRVFAPPTGLPVIVLGDLDNHPDASVTTRFGEIAFIVLPWALKRRGRSHTELRELARWVEYYSEGWHGTRLPESFTELWFDPPARPGGIPPLRSRALYHEGVEKLVGGRIARYRGEDYRVEALTGRGVDTIRVRAE